jgi:putative endonuclease
MTAAARRRAWQWGHWAEAWCMTALRLQGYRVVARRIRYPVGEIDIAARRGRTLAIIEVKARGRIADAAESVSGRQRRRIARAAEWLISEHPEFAALTVRFDVMLVVPWRWPRHLRSAWLPEIR